MLRLPRQLGRAPYPPVFVTVDALLRCQGRVLLIRRGHAPGKGLWALPGGFVEPNDTLWQSCLRELQEETHCTLPEERLRAALRGQQVFDHPQRSLRGRVITQAYFIDLGNDTLPEVLGGDDAAHADGWRRGTCWGKWKTSSMTTTGISWIVFWACLLPRSAARRTKSLQFLGPAP